jgi:hypothetical protein
MYHLKLGLNREPLIESLLGIVLGLDLPQSRVIILIQGLSDVGGSSIRNYDSRTYDQIARTPLDSQLYGN